MYMGGSWKIVLTRTRIRFTLLEALGTFIYPWCFKQGPSKRESGPFGRVLKNQSELVWPEQVRPWSASELNTILVDHISLRHCLRQSCVFNFWLEKSLYMCTPSTTLYQVHSIFRTCHFSTHFKPKSIHGYSAISAISSHKIPTTRQLPYKQLGQTVHTVNYFFLHKSRKHHHNGTQPR